MLGIGDRHVQNILIDSKTGEQEIKYVSFGFTSTMANRRPIGIKQPLYDMTEKMISAFVADAPQGLTHMGQSFGHQGCGQSFGPCV